MYCFYVNVFCTTDTVFQPNCS